MRALIPRTMLWNFYQTAGPLKLFTTKYQIVWVKLNERLLSNTLMLGGFNLNQSLFRLYLGSSFSCP